MEVTDEEVEQRAYWHPVKPAYIWMNGSTMTIVF